LPGSARWTCSGQPLPARPRLVVFVRAPVIGGAKTRLAAGIGKVMAWRAYRAMTAKTLRRVRDDTRWLSVLAVSPDNAVTRDFGPAWPGDLQRWPQGQGDLGTRQARAFEGVKHLFSSRERGEKKGRRWPVTVIGSDAPDITRRDVAQAFTLLKRHDAVIGPAKDGGYWLLALKRPAPRGLFDGIRWSSAQTRSDLEVRLRGHGLSRIAYLRELADVDEV